MTNTIVMFVPVASTVIDRIIEMAINLIEHIESYLGEISGGARDRNDGSNIQVIYFLDKPDSACTTYMSLGLSTHKLLMGSERKLRQEIILFARDDKVNRDLISLMYSVAESVLSEHKALLRGEVVNVPKPSPLTYDFCSFYCTFPSILEDGFSIYSGLDPKVVIVWLLPIFANEKTFIEENGPDAFEDVLESLDIDLLDLCREPINFTD